MIRSIKMVTLLQTLIAAEQGSFHKAGTLLGIPASTVSLVVTNKGASVDLDLGATDGNAGRFAVEDFRGQRDRNIY